MTKTKTTIIASMAILVTGILMGVQANEYLTQTEAHAASGDIYTISTEITVNEAVEKNTVSCDSGDILLTGGYAGDNNGRIYASSLPVFDANGDAKGWKVKAITLPSETVGGAIDIVINCKDISAPFR